VRRKIKEVPIVAVSAFVAKKEVEKCLNAGMNDYGNYTAITIWVVSKPFTYDRIMEILVKWMPFKLTVNL